MLLGWKTGLALNTEYKIAQRIGMIPRETSSCLTDHLIYSRTDTIAFINFHLFAFDVCNPFLAFWWARLHAVLVERQAN